LTLQVGGEGGGTGLAALAGYGLAVGVVQRPEIGDLAKAVRDVVLCNRLKEGRSLRLVMEEARPSSERLQEGFQRVADQLRDLTGLIVPGSLEADTAQDLIVPARSVSNLARKALADLKKIAGGEDESTEEQE